MSSQTISAPKPVVPPEVLAFAVAHTLANGTTEADWRSGISRAYYAAFHVARRLLESLRFRVPRADRAHSYLWLRLSNAGDAAVVAAGRRLGDLRSDRNRSDYD